MYRIKLTNGDVLQFDSLEALTGAIHAGAVSEDSLIFHQRSEQWLPISVHPHYKSAIASRPPAPAPAAPKAPVTVREMRPLRAITPKPLVATAAAPARLAPTVTRVAESATSQAPTATAGLPVIDLDRLEESLELLDPTEMETPVVVAATPAVAPVAPVVPKVEIAPAMVVVEEPAVAPAAPVVAAPAAVASPTVVPLPEPDSLVIPVGEMDVVTSASIDLAAGHASSSVVADDVLDESLTADDPTTTLAGAELLDLSDEVSSEPTPTPIDIAPRARRSPLPWIAAAAVVVGAAGTVAVMRPSSRAAAAAAPAPPRQAAGPSAPIVPPTTAARTDSGITVPAETGSLGATTPPPAPVAEPTPVVDEKAAETATRTNDREKLARDKARSDSLKAAAARDQIVAAPQVAGLGTSADVHADISPSVLAARYTAAYDEAWSDLIAKLQLNGFDQVFAAARLAPSGAGATRATIVAARASIGAFRTRTGTIEKAYRDSAAALAANGAWDPQEQKEWENRPKRAESGESVTEGNALLGTLERLYGVLAANTQAYSMSPAGLAFTDGGAQREYWELRRTLLAQLAASADAPAHSPELLVVRAIGAGRPPESVSAP